MAKIYFSHDEIAKIEALIIELEKARLMKHRSDYNGRSDKTIRQILRDAWFKAADIPETGGHYSIENFRFLVDSGVIGIKESGEKRALEDKIRYEKVSTVIETVKLNKMSGIKDGMAPWVGTSPKVLILGTMPGNKSLGLQRYYADESHNSFWKIMYSLFPCNEMSKGHKEYITSLGIALWDCIKSGERVGSTDAGFNHDSLVGNDIAAFLRTQPSIKTVVFNGRSTYSKYFLKYCKDVPVAKKILSSTANTNSIPFDKKLKEWSALKQLLK